MDPCQGIYSKYRDRALHPDQRDPLAVYRAHPTSDRGEAMSGLEDRLAIMEENYGEINEFVVNWSETAEIHLLAFRYILEENLGISMQSYLEMAASERTKTETQ